jgi:hypothetical protein
MKVFTSYLPSGVTLYRYSCELMADDNLCVAQDQVVCLG